MTSTEVIASGDWEASVFSVADPGDGEICRLVLAPPSLPFYLENVYVSVETGRVYVVTSFRAGSREMLREPLSAGFLTGGLSSLLGFWLTRDGQAVLEARRVGTVPAMFRGCIVGRRGRLSPKLTEDGDNRIGMERRRRRA
jgi:hypothetical protein